MAQQGGFGPSMEVLDVGCGIGNPDCLLAESYGCRVTGISTSVAGVEQARRRAVERTLSDRVTFLVADGMNNGLQMASFDGVWALESSHLMPRKDALLAECARVMRPGARLALCDVILPEELPLDKKLRRERLHSSALRIRTRHDGDARYLREACETRGTARDVPARHQP